MYPIKAPIYQSKQIREFERIAKERFGISETMLMQRAGKAAFDFLLRRFPQAQKIAVFCGRGNNGGDGYILAKLLYDRGLSVQVWQVGDHESIKEEAKHALSVCKKANVPIHSFHSKSDLQHPDLLVDALCGIGVHENLREEIVTAIEKIQRAEVPVYSIDMPSGIDADTGSVMGSAIHATATIALMGLKLGLLTGSGVAHTGDLICNDLQLPSELFSYVEPIAEKIHLGSYATYLKPRSRDWHKGLSGHVLIVGGALGFSGAALMAGMAALRVGAGLVSIATSKEHAPVMNAISPEIMCHGVTKTTELEPLLAKADVVIIGPGLSKSSWARTLWSFVCEKKLPLVLDADALNLLAETEQYRDHWVLTPHPGEAARLLKKTPQEVQQNRLEAVKAIHKRYGGVCVLKGAGSFILSDNALPALCDKGNPGMASAGMGDVLSGIVGGLIAQGIPATEAAKMGVCLHAMAGDLAAKEGERGMIATDLMPYLRRLVNHLG